MGFADDRDNAEELTSAPTAPVEPEPDEPEPTSQQNPRQARRGTSPFSQPEQGPWPLVGLNSPTQAAPDRSAT